MREWNVVSCRAKWLYNKKSQSLPVWRGIGSLCHLIYRCPFALSRQLFAFSNSFAWANSSARATAQASVSVDYIRSIAFRDCFNWASTSASAARYTQIRINYVCHNVLVIIKLILLLFCWCKCNNIILIEAYFLRKFVDVAIIIGICVTFAGQIVTVWERKITSHLVHRNRYDRKHYNKAIGGKAFRGAAAVASDGIWARTRRI